MNMLVRGEGKDEHADGSQDTSDSSVVETSFGHSNAVVAGLSSVVEVLAVERKTESKEAGNERPM